MKLSNYSNEIPTKKLKPQPHFACSDPFYSVLYFDTIVQIFLCIVPLLQNFMAILQFLQNCCPAVIYFFCSTKYVLHTKCSK